MAFEIDKFVMVRESQFGLEQIQAHPVWARFYEPDDIEIACSWGIKRNYFMKWLETIQDGSDHAMFPVFANESLPDDVLDVFIRATFTTPSSLKFDGYLTSDASFVSLYLDDVTNIFFSSRPELRDHYDKDLLLFDQHFPKQVLFPLEYRTPYKLSDGKALVGDFNSV